MNIGLCDDNKSWLTTAKRILEAYIAKQIYEAEIFCFQTGEELLVFQEKKLDLLFMDICLEPDSEEAENGIQTAARINEKWPDCQIIYLTNFLYFATEVYQTKHVCFVLKEQFEAKLDLFMKKALHELEQIEKPLYFQTIGGHVVRILPKDILYIERKVRVTEIVTRQKESHAVQSKIPEVYDTLPKTDFIRCHNSCIIYCPAVKEMLKNSFIMENGKEILISCSYLKTAKQAFVNWALTQTS